jgi:hypothetical protein
VWRGFKRPELRVWAIFAVVVLVFFTAIQTRLPHYVAPAYPALSLLTAVLAGEFIRARIGSNERNRSVGVVLAAIAIWTISILATHSTLKSLHSAQLGDGSALLDNKEADTLLRGTHLPAVDGPLLLLRDGPVQSIATVVFYARRDVRQVELEPSGRPRDIYKFNAKPIADAVGTEPRLILLDNDLAPRIPRDFVVTPLRSSEHMALGTILRQH